MLTNEIEIFLILLPHLDLTCQTFLKCNPLHTEGFVFWPPPRTHPRSALSGRSLTQEGRIESFRF